MIFLSARLPLATGPLPTSCRHFSRPFPGPLSTPEFSHQCFEAFWFYKLGFAGGLGLLLNETLWAGTSLVSMQVG